MSDNTPESAESARLHGVWIKADAYHFRHSHVAEDGTRTPSGRTICYVGGRYELWEPVETGKPPQRIKGGFSSASEARAFHDVRFRR